MNGTYTQRRRAQMAGGGITNARQGYFLGDLVRKIKDDIIPNELKESPVGAALLGGALVNQLGLPDFLTESMGMGPDVGQNWLGNLLGAAIPGDTQFNTVHGDTLPFMFQDTTSSQYPIGGFDQIMKDALAKDIEGIGGGFGIGSLDQRAKQALDPTGQIRQAGSQAGLSTIERLMQGNDPVSYAKNLLAQTMGTGTAGTTAGTTSEQELQRRALQNINWQTPLAVGLAAGAAQKAMSEGDVLPQDTTGINIADIRRRALTGSDPDLHFLPPASATTAYADGGRIGYQDAGDVEIPKLDTEDILKKLKNFRKKRQDYEDAIFRSERIEAQEGGLMNLGGMEKDYRQEGGFVPIGGQEKADDVPARLSKNEFVFTADAVRSAGGGDIDEGAAVMERLMENLEAGGKVSEDSQGLEGAQAMFANTQRLQNRII